MVEDNLEEEVKQMIIRRLNLTYINPDEISYDAPIFGGGEGSLGLDSIDGLEIVVGLGSEFGVTVTEENGREVLTSIRSISNFIRTKRKELESKNI